MGLRLSDHVVFKSRFYLRAPLLPGGRGTRGGRRPDRSAHRSRSLVRPPPEQNNRSLVRPPPEQINRDQQTNLDRKTDRQTNPQTDKKKLTWLNVTVPLTASPFRTQTAFILYYLKEFFSQSTKITI